MARTGWRTAFGRFLAGVLVLGLWTGVAWAQDLLPAGAIVEQLSRKKIHRPRSLAVEPAPRKRDLRVIEEDAPEKVSVMDAQRIENLPKVDLRVHFPTNQHVLTDEAEGQLRELGKALSDSRLAGRRFGIFGHTDSVGDGDYNLRLSYQRALSVREYLVARVRLPRDSFSVKGFGSEAAICPEKDDRGRQCNRRVEIVVLNQ